MYIVKDRVKSSKKRYSEHVEYKQEGKKERTENEERYKKERLYVDKMEEWFLDMVVQVAICPELA